MTDPAAGAIIRAARIKAGLTQAEAAKRLGTSPQRWHQLERGRSSPSLQTLDKVAKALGMRAVIRLGGFQLDRAADSA